MLSARIAHMHIVKNDVKIKLTLQNTVLCDHSLTKRANSDPASNFRSFSKLERLWRCRYLKVISLCSKLGDRHHVSGLPTYPTFALRMMRAMPK